MNFAASHILTLTTGEIAYINAALKFLRDEQVGMRNEGRGDVWYQRSRVADHILGTIFSQVGHIEADGSTPYEAARLTDHDTVRDRYAELVAVLSRAAPRQGGAKIHIEIEPDLHSFIFGSPTRRERFAQEAAAAVKGSVNSGFILEPQHVEWAEFQTAAEADRARVQFDCLIAKWRGLMRLAQHRG